MFRLNIGSGGVHAANWVHIDRAFDAVTREKIRRTAGASLLQYDLTSGPLPYRDDSVEYAVSHHALCMMTAPQVERLLAEVHRVLQPGGWFRISLFDILLSSDAADRGDRQFFLDRYANPDLTIAEMHAWLVHLDGARKWVTTPELLGALLIDAGFEEWYHLAYHESVCPLASIMDLDDREAESFFVEARKASA